MNTNYLLIISGATAVGKSDFAMHLAKKYQTVILSADSRQIFKEITIGTAKPSTQDLALVTHHFVNHRSINDPYSVGDYEKEAIQKITKLFEQHNFLVLVGGTGFYIDAIMNGLNPLPASDSELQQKLQNKFESEGIEYLQKELEALDPIFYKKIDTNNPHRLMRAINVCKTSGKPMAAFDQEPAVRNFKVIHLNLVRSRQELYERINDRVDQMVEAGLEAEVKALYDNEMLTNLQTVGYREWVPYFEKQKDRASVIEDIKQNSRRYAKRQLTWFRKVPNTKHFHPDEQDQMEEYIDFCIHSDATFSWSRADTTKYSPITFCFTNVDKTICNQTAFNKGNHFFTDKVGPDYQKWFDHELSLISNWL